MIKTKILGLPLGGSELVIGPVINPNFPWVVLGRAIDHLQHICRRTHARRDALILGNDEGSLSINQASDSSAQEHFSDKIEKEEKNTLRTILNRIANQKTLTESDRKNLSRIINRQIPGWYE